MEDDFKKDNATKNNKNKNNGCGTAPGNLVLYTTWLPYNFIVLHMYRLGLKYISIC